MKNNNNKETKGTAIAKRITNAVPTSLNLLDFRQELMDLIFDELNKSGFEIEQHSNHSLVDAVSNGSSIQSFVLAIKSNKSKEPKHALIGKGVMFDTGGHDLKTGRSMYGMHSDKAGAAAVIGTLIDLGPDKAKDVIGLVGFAVNSIGPDAILPGSVIKSHSGKKVEITNTDAEGRLILADLISLATRFYKVKTVTTIATLTGSMISALGHIYSGFLSNNNKMIKTIIENHHKLKMWPMPNLTELDDGHKTYRPDADLSNYNYSRSEKLDHLQAYRFLTQFLAKQSTVFNHLDIAGVATDNHWQATGYGVEQLKFILEKIRKL